MTLDLSALNPPQREAVTYMDGHLLVIAGAGSGKTRVLTTRVAYLLEQGIMPWQIMALTFTNKAAAEMRSRIIDLVGQRTDLNMHHLTMGTFHSVFLRILSREVEHTDYRPGFTIYDTSDSRSLVKTIVKEMGLDDKLYKPQIVCARISDAKNRLILPDSYAADSSLVHRDEVQGMQSIHTIYKEYQRRKYVANAMDFDDLLLETYLLLNDHPEVRERYLQRYTHILVDEYQDTNYVQNQIIRLLAGPQSRVCVVGDDAQSIYAFRGADIDNILQFEQVFSGAKVVKLEQNYRSTKTIVGAADSVISNNHRQIPKEVFSRGEMGDPITILPCQSDREEGLQVASVIRYLRSAKSLPNQEIAVLYRTNSQSRSLEEAMRLADIPYHIHGGLSFYQRAEIRNALAYIRVVCNPDDDEALRRILNFPARGIGKTTESKLIAAATEHQVSLWQVMHEPTAYGLALRGATPAKLEAFCDLIAGFRQGMNEVDAYALTARIIRESGIAAEYLKDNSVENKSARENLDELLNAIKSISMDNHEETGRDFITLPEYLGQVSLMTESTEEEGKENVVTLMTVHAAKGLEFDAVIVTGMEEELFPSASARSNRREMEEERRLFYVAITRARKYLYLTYAMKRFRYGEVIDADPSPFLDEINPIYIKGKRTAAPQRRPAPSPSSFRQPSMPSVSPRLRRLPSAPAPSSLDAQTPAAMGFAVGQHVQHERFGKGEIIRLEGAGISAKATIRFEYVGEKTLILKFARLSRL